MIKEWREIESCDKYSVSNYGDVRNDKSGRILKLSNHKQGYKIVGLPRIREDNYGRLRSQSVKVYVHRLVAMAFLGNSNLQVDHIDEDKTNNRLDNLRWLSHRENTRRSVKKDDVGHHNIYFRSNMYNVNISVNNKNTYFGCYENINDAISKRDEILMMLQNK